MSLKDHETFAAVTLPPPRNNLLLWIAAFLVASSFLSMCHIKWICPELVWLTLGVGCYGLWWKGQR